MTWALSTEMSDTKERRKRNNAPVCCVVNDDESVVVFGHADLGHLRQRNSGLLLILVQFVESFVRQDDVAIHHLREYK